MPSMIEIPRELEVEPELRFHAEHLLQAESRVGRNAPFPMNDLVEARVRDANPFGKLSLPDTKRLDELFEQHFAGMRRSSIVGNAHYNLTLVIIDDLYINWAVISPSKADAVLIVDANAVLPPAIALQRLEFIPRWESQLPQRRDRVELIELPPGNAPDVLGTDPSSVTRTVAMKEIFGSFVAERDDAHGCLIQDPAC